MPEVKILPRSPQLGGLVVDAGERPQRFRDKLAFDQHLFDLQGNGRGLRAPVVPDVDLYARMPVVRQPLFQVLPCLLYTSPSPRDS